MNIFVTGGTGFIGKTLVTRLLEQGYNVYVLTRHAENFQNQSSLKYVQGNLKDVSLLEYMFREIKPQVLIHLAWEGLPEYSLQISCQNLNYGIDLFYIAAKNACSTIISTGSCWEYESRKGKITEKSKLNSSAFFPAVKNSLRLIGKAIAHENKINFYWLRLFYVYGPGQRSTSLIPYILNSIKKGKIIRINSPNNKNDFVYVDDVAKAISSVIESKPDDTTYNIGSGSLTSIKDIVYYIYSLFHRDLERPVSEMLNTGINGIVEPDAFFADLSKIFNHTGWKAEYSIESGIKVLFNNLNHI